MIKKIITWLSRILSTRFWEFVEDKSAYFQGKGSGSDFMASEAVAACRFIKGNNVILLDVGANQGDWTSEILRRLPEKISHIYQFEPSPFNVNLLRKRFSNDPVTVVPLAVSDRAEELTLFFDKPGSGNAAVYKRRLEHFGTTAEKSVFVKAITIDSLIEERKIYRIDFMKMDIEGHELKAMHGAERALKNGVIRALSFEFGGCNIDSRTYFQDFWYFLKSFGYQIFRILPTGKVVAVQRYSEILECFRTTNYIAVLS
ncbi:MAG: FkbM family methyltransferase [Patescibacteria group bacterium]|nr:FkbM family methyltransferase [Patescibacteria group bacterium]